MSKPNRRHFLRQSSAWAGAWLIPVHASATAPARAGRARPASLMDQATAHPIAARFDDIDHFDNVHALRDGRVPTIKDPDEQCDIVIIGGGLSGLISAYRLRQHKVIVLEKEAALGGNSRYQEIAGCRYALGAFLSQGAIAPFTDFFQEIKANFLPLTPQDHAVWTKGKLVRDPLGKGLHQLPWSFSDRVALSQALAGLRPLLDPEKGISFPMARNTAEIRAYDKRTQWMQYDQQQWPSSVRHLFDTLLSARTGQHGENLSAWYGNYLLSNLLMPSYTMRGGHGDLSRALIDQLQSIQPDSLRPSFTVLRVANHDQDSVRVSGIDSQGHARTITARCAVISTPKHVAKHLVPELRQTRAPAYSYFHYNAYLVAQVFLKQRLNLPFESTYLDANLAKFVVAPDALPGNQRQDGGGLLTVYAPFPGIAGRAELLGSESEVLANRILQDLHRMHPPISRHVDQLVLHRWGHPMLTPPPNMGPALDQACEPAGRIVFAHSDNVGLTGLYSAIWAGMSAQADADTLLS